MSVLIPIPKKGNAKECSNYCTIELISYTSKIMLKMLQARLEQYMTVNFQIFNLILEKAEKPEIQLPASTGSSESKRVAEKKNLFLFIDYAKFFDCVGHNKLGNSPKNGIPDNMTCLLRNLYSGQEVTVGTRHGTTHWFQIRKGAYQGYILPSCLFNFYAAYIMRNIRPEEAQARFNITERNNSNADGTSLMAESEEELKSLLMKVKEGSENVGLKLNI